MAETTDGGRLVIRGGTLVLESALARADLIVQGERIAGIVADADVRPDDRVIDASGLLVLPGGIDAHTHARDPMSRCARDSTPRRWPRRPVGSRRSSRCRRRNRS